ncbi:MAG: hypothetical protein GY827_05090 [Cytophagales bacterium]|nr:hypothetical protein [Cytophagales bacterium]
MQKFGILFGFIILNIGIAQAQFFKTEDFEKKPKAGTVEQEQRHPNFQNPPMTQAEEDSLRALFSEGSFKKKKPATPPTTPNASDGAFLTPNHRKGEFVLPKQEA